MRTIDLFAGVGGLRLGFEQMGFETVYATDIESACKLTYDLNFSQIKLNLDDVSKIQPASLPDFDILLAGFPCQPFSVAGYRQGFGDHKGRGNLFFDIARIIEEKQPLGFLLENVKNLHTHHNGKTYETIMNILDKLGYECDSKVMNTLDYGNLPQNRERIYIIGFQKSKSILENFEWLKKVKLKTKITDLLESTSKVDEKYYYSNKPLWSQISDYPFKRGWVYQWRRKYIRINKQQVCPTLTANMGTGGHNVPLVLDKRGVRKLTPRECFRLQGFPASYKLPSDLVDSHLYKQAGNSVSVGVVSQLAHQIQKAVLVTNTKKSSNKALSNLHKVSKLVLN